MPDIEFIHGYIDAYFDGFATGNTREYWRGFNAGLDDVLKGNDAKFTELPIDYSLEVMK